MKKQVKWIVAWVTMAASVEVILFVKVEDGEKLGKKRITKHNISDVRFALINPSGWKQEKKFQICPISHLRDERWWDVYVACWQILQDEWIAWCDTFKTFKGFCLHYQTSNH